MAYKRNSPTPVVEGGTGIVTSTTAYAPICGGTTATGAFQAASTGLGTAGYVLTSNGSSALPSFQAASGGSITITGDTGGGLSGTSFTFTGGSTGLSFDGSGSTQTLSFAGITANGGTVSLATDATASTVNIGTGAGVKTVTLGSTNSTSSTTINFGGSSGSALSTYIAGGTFTPGVTINGSATGITFGSRTGHYSRIGNIVTFTISIVLTSKGSSSGNVVITDLPFAALVASRFYLWMPAANAGQYPVSAATSASSTSLGLFLDNNGIIENITNAYILNFTEFYISGSYLV